MATPEDSQFIAPEIRRRPLRRNEEMREETLKQQHGGGLAAELSVRGAAEVLGSLPEKPRTKRPGRAVKQDHNNAGLHGLNKDADRSQETAQVLEEEETGLRAEVQAKPQAEIDEIMRKARELSERYTKPPKID